MSTLRIATIAALFVLSTTATWAADPIGEWKGEGPRGEISIVISQDADGSLQGQMITARGSNDLTNLSLNGIDFAFTNHLEFDDRSIDLNFAGTIDGNSFNATISTPQGERPITLTRAADSGGIDGLVGTWNLTGESQFGPMEHTLIATPDGKITYESSGQTEEATNIEIDGATIAFDITTHGGGGSYDVAFQGSFDDTTLTGDIISNGSSFVTLTAPRQSNIAHAIGTWNLTGESRYGPVQHTLIITPDGAHTYESGGEISDVTNLEIDATAIRFNMTIFGGGNAYPLSFEGAFNEDGLSGDVISAGGDSFSSVKAPRN